MRYMPRLGTMVRVCTLVATAAACGLQAFALDVEDKRQLEHEDYALWTSVGSQSLSNDGKWASCVLRPAEGDETLVVRQIATAKEYLVKRASGARFSFDNQYVAFTVSPDPELLKKLRKAKTPDNLLPKDGLEIIHLESGRRTSIADAGRFSMPEKASGWIAFKVLETKAAATLEASKSELTETFEITSTGIRRPEKPKKMRKPSPAPAEAEPQQPTTAKGKSKETAKPESEEKKADDTKKKDKSLGTTLVLRNLETHVERRFPFVENYRFSEDGSQLAFTTSAREGEQDGVHVVQLSDMKTTTVLSGLGEYGQVVFSKDGKQLAFLTDRDDTNSDEPKWSLYLWKSGQKVAQVASGPESKGLPEGWVVASNSAPMFTEDGRRLLFRTRPGPEDKPDAEAEQEPKAKLDIWHWQDPFLQPQQLLQVARERGRSYQAVYDLRTRKTLQLATLEIPSVSVDPRSEADIALGVSPDKYNKMRSWDTQGFSDWHLIDLKTGVARELARMKRGSPSLSPSGKFVSWWDGEARTWFSLPTSELKGKDVSEVQPVDIGSAVGQPLFDELHDSPSLPGPYGVAGWLADDAGLLIYDSWDLWLVDPSGSDAPVCVTGGEGRNQKIKFRRVRLDFDERTIDLSKPQTLSALVHQTKASGYYRLAPAGEDGSSDLQPLIMLDENVDGLRKAKESDAVLFTRSTFSRCPDLWASTMEFKTMRRLTRSNPQQDDYVWGSAELVHWNAKDGQPLDGILYKPEGFDADKKYPMLVYFYERNSDNLHSYYAPAAGRSIINFSFYVSRGYVVFIPDIPYKVGEPGPSAANAILPGVESILAEGYVDPQRVGMQGHSWGGYQTAYLVTQTDMFACAESGAPVSNMTSAYGGIRWGSGMSRMFQYEKTQSRIGGTLWEDRDKYIANSPVFFADQVNTPLLILHNDEDTAVPWYQGIELFVALRRLEKPAWMLNYNGDPHWVMSDANRMDFAMRMQQFFDHYLKGEPMPVWMADGIPAIDKGKDFGFEYVAPAATPEAEPAP